MSLTIRHFKVLDTSTGKMAQHGRRTSNQINTIRSQFKFTSNLVERKRIPGTPNAPASGAFTTESHMGKTFIEIVKTHDLSSSHATDVVFIPDRIRLTKLCGVTSAQLTLLYGFTHTTSVTASDIIWHVAFAHTNQQADGDYIDLDLPDMTVHSRLFIVLTLINDVWQSRTIENASLKLCSIPGNLDYFCMNPDLSNADIGQSHTIVVQGDNSHNGISSRCCVTFEDWYMNKADRDYNDIALSISSISHDENMTNDTSLS